MSVCVITSAVEAGLACFIANVISTAANTAVHTACHNGHLLNAPSVICAVAMSEIISNTCKSLRICMTANANTNASAIKTAMKSDLAPAAKLLVAAAGFAFFFGACFAAAGRLPLRLFFPAAALASTVSLKSR